MITLYRGIVKGRQRQLKAEGTGIWFSSSIDVAKTYSDTVEVWELNDELNLTAAQMNCNGKSWNEVHTDSIARKYVGKDVILFKDIVDVGPEWFKRIPDKAKKSKDTVRQALTKYFIADDWVVNNPDCIKKIQTINFKENKMNEIFEHVFKEAEVLRASEKAGLNEMYVPDEMRPKPVTAEEYVNNFFDNYCDADGFADNDKIQERIGANHHSVFALYRTVKVLEKYPLNRSEALAFVKSSGKPNREALEDYVRQFCAEHDEN